MHANPCPVADAVARRVVSALRTDQLILVCAPPPYHPRRIVDRAVALLDVGRVTRLRLTGDEPQPSVIDADLVVLHVDDADDRAAQRVRRLLADPALVGTRVVVAAELDGCDWAELLTVDRILRHQDLVLTEDEILAVHPEAADPVVLHQILHQTGGVPALSHVPYSDPRRYVLEVEEAARPWAAVVLPQVHRDPLLRLQATLGRAGDDTVATVATALLERTVTPQEVRELRESSTAVTVAGPHRSSLPDGLTSAVFRAWGDADPAAVDAWHADVLKAADAVAPDLTGLERIRVYSTLGEWQRVDEVLATTMHPLVHLTAAHVTCVRSAWPKHFPPALRHLTRARRYLDGLERPARISSSTPEAWQDLGYLLSAQRAPEPGSTLARLREWFDPLAAGGRPASATQARRQLLDAARWLVAEAATGLSLDRRRHDEAAVVCGTLLGAADAGLVLGEMGIARDCSSAAVRMSMDMGARMDHYSGLRRGVMLRAALMAAHGGLPRAAEAQLAEADRYRVGQEASQDALRSLAAAYAVLDLGQAGPEEAPLVDPDRAWAPHESTIRTLELALWRGPEAGARWAGSMLQRAAWAGRPGWEWWPLQSVLVMLLLRRGMIGQARSVLERAQVPGSLNAVLLAALECAAGRTGAAAAQLDHALRSDQLSNRWRIVATGVQIACIVDDPARADDVRVLANSQDWGNVLGALAVLPDAALTAIAPLMGQRLARYPGLAVAPTPVAGGVDGALTRRQREVLQALAEGGTMADVARRLVVSTETVRSTAKAAYKRLGAGDRAGALAIARARGLI
ncbi:LuxR C-terminal-related transcriptional regulator [Tessaracoccus lapidicaptus]|uniref:LuxR C-terminal-related transcriptional regulator n=1 Tax=Tessaracoccus lapidicaptus TaxID=1427523 RepID=UPI0033418FB1